MEDPEAAARAGLRRSMLIYFALLAAAGLVIYWIVASGVTGFGYVTLSVVTVVALLLGYQVVQHYRDLSAPLAESAGVVQRKWSRADLVIAMQSYYVVVDRVVFRLRADEWALIDETMYVKIVHFPRTLNVVTIHEVRG